jgi:hypothetical protein
MTLARGDGRATRCSVDAAAVAVAAGRGTGRMLLHDIAGRGAERRLAMGGRVTQPPLSITHWWISIQSKESILRGVCMDLPPMASIADM